MAKQQHPQLPTGGINPFYASVEAVRQAGELLPAEYRTIDEDWLEENSTPVDMLKKAFAEKGGIHLLEVGDFRIICRAPSREILNKSAAGASADKRIDADMTLVSQCMLYPAPAVLGRWMDEHAGLASSFASKLMEIAKVSQEVHAKKL